MEQHLQQKNLLLKEIISILAKLLGARRAPWFQYLGEGADGIASSPPPAKNF